MNNLEQRARAFCAQDLLSAGWGPADIEAKVDRLWPVVAREIADGVSDPALPPIEDMEQRKAEYDAAMSGARAPATEANSPRSTSTARELVADLSRIYRRSPRGPDPAE